MDRQAQAPGPLFHIPRLHIFPRLPDPQPSGGLPRGPPPERACLPCLHWQQVLASQGAATTASRARHGERSGANPALPTPRGRQPPPPPTGARGSGSSAQRRPPGLPPAGGSGLPGAGNRRARARRPQPRPSPLPPATARSSPGTSRGVRPPSSPSHQPPSGTCSSDDLARRSAAPGHAAPGKGVQGPQHAGHGLGAGARHGSLHPSRAPRAGQRPAGVPGARRRPALWARAVSG